MRIQQCPGTRPLPELPLAAFAKKVPAKRRSEARNCPLGTQLIRMLTIALFEAGQLEVDSMEKKTRPERAQH